MYQRLDYAYELPQELIASRPAATPTASRLLLMHLGAPELIHGRFSDLVQYLRPKDLLVFNNTKVIPARLLGHKIPSEGVIEALVERILPNGHFLCQLKFSRPPGIGQRLHFSGVQAVVCRRCDDFFELQFVSDEPPLTLLERIGKIPLPPYIKRPADAGDWRYQTVYASKDGAVAAPTAGLHFDRELLNSLAAKGIGCCELTLHVGAGTFQAVRSTDIRQHRMHKEWCEVPADIAAAIARHRAAGGRVIAVGTTSARALETAVSYNKVVPFSGETDIFIYPPYRFRAIDGMITNFHMPESTLLMLVCAFAGCKPVLAAYAEAVARQYRFLSYGDAMLILPDTSDI